MDILQDLSYEELKNEVLALNEKAYRAEQIFTSLHLGNGISEISNISKELRGKLLEKYHDFAVKIVKKLISKDGTQKYLFSLCDGNIIEGVFMKNKYGNTLCLSTQVGCRMGCKFCASGIGGLVRNLTSGEMLATVCLVNKDNGGNIKNRSVTNIVLMGSGEPLDNYDNTIKFLRLVSSEKGINISLRNISLSTCGIVPKMYKLADEGLPINLTISLHQPFDEKRKQLMPIAKTYKIEEILKACDYYFEKTGRRYIFEYSLVKGENNDKSSLNELIRILKGRPCHVNIIRLNEVKEANLKSTSDKEAYAFCDALNLGGISATVRRLNGADIEGACGQLRRSYITDNAEG